MDLEQMLKELADLRYTEQGYNGNTREYRVITTKYMDKVEDVIRKYMNRSPYIEQVNMLSAKVYAYEQIIAKSNFAPMLKDGNKQELEWISMKDKRPLQGEEVIITCKDGLSFETYVTTGAYDHDAGVFELDDEHTISVLYVIAWMPLPAPYKEEKHE